MNTAMMELFRHYVAGTSVLNIPTIGEILADIDTRYPNTCTAAQKIGWINDELRETSREIPLENICSFTTLASSAIITLPVNIPIDGIVEPILITVEDTAIDAETSFDEYYFIEIDSGLSGHKYYRADFGGLNNIGIYPVPEVTGLIGMFIYEAKPSTLSAADLTVKPGVQGDWVNLLKWKCMQRIAQSGNNPDTQMANNFQSEYDELKDLMQMAMFRKKLKNKKPANSNRWWNR